MIEESKRTHLPERTCVVCRNKNHKDLLLRFILLETEIVFDAKALFPSRGYYVCNENTCILNLNKWKQKKRNRK